MSAEMMRRLPDLLCRPHLKGFSLALSNEAPPERRRTRRTPVPGNQIAPIRGAIENS